MNNMSILQPSGSGQPVPSGIKRVGSKDSVVALAFKAMDNDVGEVNLSAKSIGDSQMNEIVNNLKKMPTARCIDLSSNKITDEGVQHLARGLAELNQVQMLVLANNKLTEKCIEPIAATLRMSKHLRVLDLSGNGISNRVFKNKIKNVLTWVEIKF